jgi:D-beta-D-heptose 7-phosphate kinase/D-beta-D-heptose 1-phosphate adenosyltransferase
LLVVAINSDSSVGRLKDEARPLVPETGRAAMTAGPDRVDAATVFDEDTTRGTLDLVPTDVFVEGQDERPDQVVGRELAEARGGTVEPVLLLPEHSTARLVDRFRGRRSS